LPSQPVSAETAGPFPRASEAQSEYEPGYSWPPHLYRDNLRIAKPRRASQIKALESSQGMATLPQLYARYLRLLGVTLAPPGLDGLRNLVRRHLLLVPFENVSKLLLLAREGAGRPTTLSEFLDGIEDLDLGGTCYTSNPFLADLLRHLGYEADLLGADMSLPNIHTCIRVRLGNVPYHVDVGYGGPFREPLRLDRLPHEFTEGSLRYVLERNHAEDAYGMTVFSGPDRVHGYVVHPPPRPLDFFHPVVRESFARGRTFMSCLRLVRIFDSHSVELRDRTLTVHRAGKTTQTELNSLAELKAAVAGTLAMPRCPIETAVEILEQLTGRRFFG